MAGMINYAVESQTPFTTTFKNEVWSTVAQCYIIKFLVCKGGNLNNHTVKPVLNSHSKIKKRRPKIGFQDHLLLNAGQNRAFCNTFNLR